MKLNILTMKTQKIYFYLQFTLIFILQSLLIEKVSAQARFIPVGQAIIDNPPVYLDLKSISQVNTSSFRYTTKSNPGAPNRYETDSIVNCSTPDLVTIIESRYYVANKKYKTETINRTQKASIPRTSNIAAKANALVCKSPNK